jgi:2,4-dienoyl-CoA reductase-like NADH-dependent reductase (Old Yellow Enzyme family)/thioredoxin reductase
MNDDFSPLFRPLEIGRGDQKLLLKNRMVMAPMVTNLADSSREVTPQMIDYYMERARGGVGTIVVEAMDIEERTIFHHRLGIFHDRFISELENLASQIRETRTAAIGQIYHPGTRGNFPGPDELTKDEIQKAVEAFGKAAERVKRAGFDGVMIHGAHGYLISSFLCPLTNRRKDEYGGDREQRAKLAVEVIRSVRRAVGAEFPIFFRMNGEDFFPGGITVEDAMVTAPIAEAAGADVIAVGGGIGTAPGKLPPGLGLPRYGVAPPMFVPRGDRVEGGARIKQRLKIPLSIAGRISDPWLARDVIARGQADLVDLGRPLLADPSFPRKIAAGRMDEIRRCIACNFCLDKRQRQGKQVHCAVNAQAGRESEANRVGPASFSGKVLVIGGGIAGMEAARWLAKRGHRVSLYEKGEQLGGQATLAALPPRKEEIHTFVAFLTGEMKRLGVEIHLGSEVTPELALKEKPDAAVIATGAAPVRPAFPIDAKVKCVSAWDVLLGKEKDLGSRAVVLGGGFVGAETAEYICEKKLAGEVAIAEMRRDVAFDLDATFREPLIERLKSFGVKMVTDFLVTEVTGSGVVGQDTKGGRVETIKADTVVLALGTAPAGFPLDELKKTGIETHVIGDAHSPRGIAEAVREGYLVGIFLGAMGTY